MNLLFIFDDYFKRLQWRWGASLVALVVKNLPANAGDTRDKGLIPELGIYPREEHSNPLQYSCLENPMDRGALQGTVHGLRKSQTRLSDLTFVHSLP